jgi:ABC-type nitrate/sulfonate/bicarbonate transport system substrate-binding protein
VPLSDAAPLIVAQEWGCFARHSLEVRLSRELGWATIRDKLIHGELDGAHALNTLPVALAHGLGAVKTDVVAGMFLNLHGNAITLSNELWRSGVRDQATLRSFLAANRNRRTLTLGTVALNSTHSYLLKSWFQRAGANFESDVRLVVVPPAQLEANLAGGISTASARANRGTRRPWPPGMRGWPRPAPTWCRIIRKKSCWAGATLIPRAGRNIST